MTDWMVIRVVLTEGGGRSVDPPPGRIMLVHADHAFGDLAEAIDVAFGRWDLSHLHEFEVEGRRLIAPGGEPLDVGAEDSDDVTLGEVGLRAGARFTYTFDLGDQWRHECVVEQVDVDPYETFGEEPDDPVPVWGWGSLPDQYWRRTEDDDVQDWEEGDDADSTDEVLSAWADADARTWAVVEAALADSDCPLDEDALASALAQVRAGAERGEWPYDLLWAVRRGPQDAGERPNAQLWTDLAAGVVDPRSGAAMEAEEAADWAALEPADWAGAVIGLVRAGPGQPADPESILSLIVACPEVEEQELSPDDRAVLLAGLKTVTVLLAGLGAIDGGRLTELGCWGLPRALERAWAS